MKRSRKILLGVAAVGLQVGLASAAEPPAPPAPAPDGTPPAVTAAQPCRAADSCCDTESGGSAAQHGGLIAGAGVYLFQPYFNPHFPDEPRLSA
jgi:hypothetical protein